VEFSAEGTRITLTQPGEYSVRQLMTGARSLRAANAGRVLSTILRALPSVTRNQGSSTSGLRGDAMPVDDAGWLADNADLYYGEARDMLGAGRPDAAIEWLETGLPQVEPDREPEGRYLLAQALSMKGDTREALRQLDMVALTGREYWAGDFVLLKAKILIEASAFEPAVQWLSQRSLADDPALAAPYYLLLALAHRGAGDTEGEKQALENAVSAAGNGELGSEAARLLESP
jgi:tetratricopeptide (TPR) repeat protein